MRLEGSCHCRAVRFSVESHEPYPYMRCYCSICRKTQGGGGYAVCISGDNASLRVRGMRNVGAYRARMPGAAGKRATRSPARRHFCVKCSSALWVWDPRWPELCHPFASAIDTPLPKPPEEVEIMLDYAAPWCEIPRGPKHRHFREYPTESIAGWHKKRGLTTP